MLKQWIIHSFVSWVFKEFQWFNVTRLGLNPLELGVGTAIGSKLIGIIGLGCCQISVRDHLIRP